MIMRQSRPLSVLCMAMAVWLASCGPSPTSPPPATPSVAGSLSASQILIKDFKFVPATLTVKAGTQVTWVNHDDEAHNVIISDGIGRSGAIDTDEKYTFKFAQPGEYPIRCSMHHRMGGTIVVQ